MNAPTHVAIIQRFYSTERKAVIVPAGQNIEMGEDGSRPWLVPYLQGGWNLVEFMEIHNPFPQFKRDANETYGKLGRSSPMYEDGINLELLLRKYMTRVMAWEGYNYIGKDDAGFGPVPSGMEITPEERAYLLALAEKIS